MAHAVYDAIVVGLGGMGAATVHELARRGGRVLGLEQFTLGHGRGSTHGQTRIIRKAYYEHPDYVPLLHRAYERWFDLEQATGRHLLTHCGCLSIGPPEHELIVGARRSADEHGLAVETLSAGEIGRRFPAFRVAQTHLGVLEADGGFLRVEECLRAHLDEARRYGADLHAEDTVQAWRAVGGGVEVVTEHATYSAGKLVIAAGPWAGQVLSQLGLPLTLMRQVPCWFAPRTRADFRRDRFPCFICVRPEGAFYGFPVIDARGLKVAQHYGGAEVQRPDAIDRQIHDDDELQLRQFIRATLPTGDGPRIHAEVCTYTLTPDRHFVLDHHPDHARVAIAAGFSGHGYKFASVVGEIMADLVEHGRTPLPVAMFGLGRFHG